VGLYDYRLVVFSVLLAILASYVALDLAARVTVARGRARHAWLAGGAISMGFGIWSMHFVGMLAFRLPTPVRYFLPTVLLSLLAAILASAVALYLAGRRRFGRREALVGSLLMGGGIAAMHYLGMASMRLSAMCHYNPLLLWLSIAIAVLASFAALALVFDFHDEPRGTTPAKIAGATAMGLAIAAMHYTAMAGASFIPFSGPADFLHAVSISGLGTAAVVTVTLLILAFTLLMTLMGRQFAARALDLELTEQRYRLLFEHCFAGAYRTTLEGRILDCNEALVRISGYASRDELLAHNVVESYFSPADREAVITLLKEKKILANLELRLRAKDGRAVWVLGNATLVEGRGGAPPVIEGTLIDITERKRAEEALREAHEDLEARVRERTAQLASINEALRDEIAERERAEEALRRLSGELLRSQDEERRKIARDLHDSTGQDLVALAAALKQLQDALHSSSKKLRRLLSDCQALADQCIREVRTLSYVLHPPMLDEAGLEDAIRHYLDGLTKRSGIQVDLEVSRRFGRMTRDVELVLFRVVQESLTNVQRHSGGSQAKIRLDRNADEVILEVSDNGRGTSGKERKGSGEIPFEVGVGIASMQERVKLVGGRFDIDSSSQGTTVRVTMPLSGEKHAKATHSDS
jgi:PAS domain S-box-containing protein